MTLRPPTPKDSPSPQPDNNVASSSLHQRKRQRTDDGPSSLSRTGSPVPLTPPPSSRASPVSETPCTIFDSLSPELQEKIILETVAISTRSAAQIGDYTRSVQDPRILNKGLNSLLYRRRKLTQLATVNKFWRRCLEPLLLEGPRVVVSADELSDLAGNEYRLDGKTIERPTAPRYVWADYQPKDPGCPPRRRVKQANKADIPEIICWMTCVPWRKDNSEIGLRWPRWYILDWMRYDLEDLKVRKLAVIAAYQATIAETLNATIPNHDRITELHFEVFHQMGAMFASDPRFDNVYRHCPDTQHLCNRLQLHRDTLDSLSLRNIAVCPILGPHQFPRLRNLDLYWVNNLPGLCQDHYPDPLDSNRMPYAVGMEVYELRWQLNSMARYRPRCRVWVAMSFDRPNLETGQWGTEHQMLVMRKDSGEWITQEHLWADITYGVRTHADLQVFDEGEENYSDDLGCVDDDEEEEEEDDEEEAIEIEEDDEDDEKKGKGRSASRVGNERAIAPAPRAYRPLRIR